MDWDYAEFIVLGNIPYTERNQDHLLGLLTCHKKIQQVLMIRLVTIPSGTSISSRRTQQLRRFAAIVSVTASILAMTLPGHSAEARVHHASRSPASAGHEPVLRASTVHGARKVSWRTRPARAAADRTRGRLAHAKLVHTLSAHALPLHALPAHARLVDAALMHRADATPAAGHLPVDVLHALSVAQQTSTIDPHLLLGIAATESGFNAHARNRHSSAQGLLQFTNATWLTVVRDFGARHGLGQYAAAIDTDRDGRLTVRKARLRRAILALRDDPVLETVMTAERLEQERRGLEAGLGHRAEAADLYFLHLLGPSGASHFLKVMATHPDASSIATVGGVAAPNAGLFIRNGRPLSVAAAYSSLQHVLNQQALRYDGVLQSKSVLVADAR